MRILVTGGTGFVGRRLCAALAERGHDLRVLTRAPGGRAAAQLPAAVECRALPADVEGWADAVRGCEAIVNLAGESIAAQRWTDARKRQIRDSRVETTRHLVEACRAAFSTGGSGTPRVLVNASAIGFYGPHGDEALDESAPAGSNFLARVCVDWEAEAQRGEAIGLRVVRLRLGVVVGEGGGALARMVVPFRLFAGGPLGGGRQWMSWIDLDDVVGLAAFALEHEAVTGAVNATAPDPRTMRDFCAALGRVLHRPSWAPVPAFALRLALGEMAEMLLEGQRVLPAAALAAGYAFRRPQLEPSLRAALHLD